MNICLVWQDGTDFILTQKYYRARPPIRIFFPYKHPATMSPQKLSLCKLHIFSVVIII